MKQNIIGNTLSLFLVILLAGCLKDLKYDLASGGTVNVDFKPVVGAVPLDFTTTYRNAFGEDFSVQTFKFYISAIELINSQTGKNSRSNEYFLVDASDAGSKAIHIKASPNQYDRIAFIIGVDSAKNVSGAQTGALDPAKGMFWTWNSGYIMAKFEGSSSFSNQPNNRFEYHIGGFEGDENVVQRIELPFPASTELEVKNNETTSVLINADANAWFKNTSDIKISTTPVCTTPGSLAKSIANNYSKMFDVVEVLNN